FSTNIVRQQRLSPACLDLLTNSLVTDEQLARLAEILAHKDPLQLAFDFGLWTTDMEVVPSSVELRWRSGEHQAALT
ncbi:hypothetical protein, partial [Mycobacterium helveticum]|uniref:hypothetical protein n=1 Tax=Mycobacterium helveticum TaxID=2592811 RepID=UPI001AEF5E9A